MQLYDAINEMRKDSSKIFGRTDSCGTNWLLRWRKGIVEHNAGAGWSIAPLSTPDQTSEWTEVSPWKDVDYAEFMEWYCNPNNKGKNFRAAYKCATNTVEHTQANDMRISPAWFCEECVRFAIPTE